MDTMGAYREIIKENIEYGIMRERLGYNADLSDGYSGHYGGHGLQFQTHDSHRRRGLPTRNCKEPASQNQFEHIGYVVDSLKENTTKVRNIRAYLLTSLYNAPTTMNSYYTALVNHDLYGGG